MSAFYLVLYIYAGVMAKGDSVAMASIPQQSLQSCQESGKQAEHLVSGSTKTLRFICVKGSAT